ncbi:hypothetical protein AUP07_0233 [methanogenic archaeon mixed culture ISO4-G1]|nr:hypothetical protein AUP07_0233 [methanogenic archaeon mixed culture ISO4-G1]
MACFLVAATVGVFTTAFRNKIPEKYHIGWLNIMIWGGVLALLVEHIWHGEIVPWPPFLTAMSDPEDTAEMLAEMGEIGVPMLLIILAIWAIMVFIANRVSIEMPTTETA